MNIPTSMWTGDDIRALIWAITTLKVPASVSQKDNEASTNVEGDTVVLTFDNWKWPVVKTLKTERRGFGGNVEVCVPQFTVVEEVCLPSHNRMEPDDWDAQDLFTVDHPAQVLVKLIVMLKERELNGALACAAEAAEHARPSVEEA